MGFAEPAQAWDLVCPQSGGTLVWGHVCCGGRRRERLEERCAVLHECHRGRSSARPLPQRCFWRVLLVQNSLLERGDGGAGVQLGPVSRCDRSSDGPQGLWAA